MNINSYILTTPHYDSYEDFYKFFEVRPKETKEGAPVEVFPFIEEPGIEKRKKEGILDKISLSYCPVS